MLIDPIILYFVVSAFVALSFGVVLSVFKQPVFIGYILAGFLLGPNTFGFFDDLTIVNQLGSIGVVLLLFFIGMEVSPRQLIHKWRIALLGASAQLLVSVLLVAALGLAFDWPLNRIVLIGFVISLSCTAVVVDYMKNHHEQESDIYQNLVAILVAQDILVVPMLIILGLLGGEQSEPGTIWLQLIGGVVLVLIVMWFMGRDLSNIRLLNKLEDNSELQVFCALLFCFALSFLTGVLNLSTALGSFIAGLLINKTRYTGIVSANLGSLKIIFVALFFGSIGALIDPRFIVEHWLQIAILLILLFMVNTLANSAILHWLGCSWRDSVYGGALLAHIGEFSFVLAAIGLNMMIVSDVAYQLTVAVIALSLLFGPLWAAFVRRLTRRLPAH